MKFRDSLSIAVRVVVFFAALPSISARAGETVHLRADEWCPYTCVDASTEPGYLIEVAREIFGRAGISVEYKTVPWPRAVADTAAGVVDGAAGAARDEVPGGIVTRHALGRSRNMLALREGTAFEYRDVTSLLPLRIGAAQGYSFDNGPLDAYIAEHVAAQDGKVELVSGTEVQSINIRKLLVRRIDAVLDDENVLFRALAELQPRAPVKLVAAGEPQDVFIAFSPKSSNGARYAKILDDGVDELRGSGKLRLILAKYRLTDWE